MSLNCEPKLAHFMPKLARVATFCGPNDFLAIIYITWALLMLV